jgi:uncharacterized membrane protein
MRLMRILAVCFSTVALAITLVGGGLVVALGAVGIWMLTLFALALSEWRDHRAVRGDPLI